MSGNGWISLHRSVQNHWLFTEKRKFSKFEAWVDLLLLMNHADAKKMFREELIHIKRGQHVTSIRKLSDRWGWSRTKTENFLSLLESEHMIQFEKATNKTLVTVVNYDFYQSDNLKKSQYQNENENKIPEKRATEEPVSTQENQGVSESGDQKESHEKASKKPVKSPNNNVNNENNLNNVINNNNNESSWLEDFEADYEKEADKRSLIIEIEKEYQARKGEDPELPPNQTDRNIITAFVENSVVKKEEFTREEIFEGINHAFLTAAKQNKTVFSFNYCITSIISQKEYKQRQKNVVPFNKQKKQQYNKPDSSLPISIRQQMEREEREKQGIKEPELSPEEEAKQRAELKKLLEEMGIHREDLA